jgi:hypothetical protein
MEYSNDLSKKIKDCQKIIADMISKAKSQGDLNFDMLYSVQNVLNELSIILQNRQKANSAFIKKWNNVMGFVPRVFEDHPLLNGMRDIDQSLSLS